ncbi:MAG: ribbon-helix-helix protein, CopG family [Tepidiformaceae bacterium]
MKTAISLPDDIAARLDDIAKERGESRSGVIAKVLEDFFEKLDDDETTRRLNEVYSDSAAVAETLEMASAGKRAFRRTLESDPDRPR